MIRFLRRAAILCVVLTPVATFAQDKSFNSNGVQIRYVEQGTGDPVVLVHGRGDTIESSWVTTGVLASLAKSYRVIALDCRGHGKSGKPHDSKQYGPEMGLDIVRLLDHLGIARAHVVGYSMGANIVSQLLTTHPDRFLTATLGGSAGRFRWTAKDDESLEEEAVETERWGFSPSLQLRNAPPNTPKLTQEEIRRRSAMALADSNQDRHAVAALIRSFRYQVITPAQVSAVRVPTMGIAGSEDPRLLDVQDLKKLRPALHLVVIDGATHSGERGARNRPEFVTAIREFISSQGGRPTLEGVWKVTEIVVTGAGAYTESAPQPSVFIFAKTHYSLMWVPGSVPRTLFKAQVPTNEEKMAAFDSLAASAGTYEVSGSTVTFRFIVARSPNAAFIAEQFSVEGDTMTLSWVSSDSHMRIGQDVVLSNLPVSKTRMKLVRVE